MKASLNPSKSPSLGEVEASMAEARARQGGGATHTPAPGYGQPPPVTNGAYAQPLPTPASIGGEIPEAEEESAPVEPPVSVAAPKPVGLLATLGKIPWYVWLGTIVGAIVAIDYVSGEPAKASRNDPEEEDEEEDDEGPDEPPRVTRGEGDPGEREYDVGPEVRDDGELDEGGES